MYRKEGLLFVITLLFAVVFSLMTNVSAIKAVDELESGLQFEQYELENGLDVILIRDTSAPTVAVNIWYSVGGANDPTDRSGFAHLFEHMMFQGTANLEKGVFDRLTTQAGAVNNAYTTIDHTAYYEALPSNQLPLALWLEADRMSSLAVNQINLDNQRAVVIEEYQQRYGNSPYGEGILELLRIPYTYEPYKRGVIGSIEDLNTATVEEITDFHSTYYKPNNATLAVVGDIDFEQTKALIDEYFAQIPPGEDPPALPEYSPVEQTEAQVVTLEDDLINIPAVLIGYETPSRSHPDYPAIELLTLMLSTGDSSRLAKLLLDTGEALVADSVVLSNAGPSLFGVLLLPNMTSSPETVEQIFYDELERIRTEGVDDAELEKTINQIRSGRIAALESVFDLSESVQEANFYFGTPDPFAEINRFQQVTSEDIQRVISEYLSPEDRHVIYVNPGAPQAFDDPAPFVGAVGDESDEAFTPEYVLPQNEPPEALPISEFTLPNITESRLSNGLDVIVVEQADLPVISLDLFMRGGESLVPADQSGLASTAGFLLTRGTENRTAQELAAEIEQGGGFMGSGAGNDSLSAGVFALIENADLAFELLGDAVLNPTFPENEIEVYKENLRTGLEADLADPNALAGRAFRRLVYGEHPYGSQLTQDSINAINRDAIVEYYAKVNHPENAFLIVAGDITTEEALQLAEATFGDWQGEGAAPEIGDFDAPENDEGLHIYLVDVPGAAQAQMIMGNVGVYGDNPNRHALALMNEILGGDFSSRLMQNIREDKGYTYGIGSSFTYPADLGLFRVSAAIRNDAIEDAINEILAEIERIKSEEVPEDEVAFMRDGLVGQFALQIETYQQFVNQIASLKLRGLELGAIADYPGLIAAVGQADILENAQEFIPDDLIIVVAGDASLIQEQLETIGEVTVLPAE